MPVPQSVAQTLSDEIVDILLKRDMVRQLSECEVHRAQTLINELAKVHPAFAHSLRGGLLGMQRKFDEALREHHRAIAAEPKNIVIRTNFGSTLMEVGRYDDAVTQYKAAYDMDEHNISALGDLIEACYYADKDEEFRVLLERYRSLAGNTHPAETWLAEDEEDIASLPELEEESRTGTSVSLEELKKELGL